MEKCGKSRRRGESRISCLNEWNGIASEEERGEGVMMHACSACAGDYEDPDRTARITTEEDDGEEDDALCAQVEEFPAAE